MCTGVTIFAMGRQIMIIIDLNTLKLLWLKRPKKVEFIDVSYLKHQNSAYLAEIKSFISVITSLYFFIICLLNMPEITPKIKILNA